MRRKTRLRSEGRWGAGWNRCCPSRGLLPGRRSLLDRLEGLPADNRFLPPVGMTKVAKAATAMSGIDPAAFSPSNRGALHLPILPQPQLLFPLMAVLTLATRGRERPRHRLPSSRWRLSPHLGFTLPCRKAPPTSWHMPILWGIWPDVLLPIRAQASLPMTLLPAEGRSRS